MNIQALSLLQTDVLDEPDEIIVILADLSILKTQIGSLKNTKLSPKTFLWILLDPCLLPMWIIMSLDTRILIQDLG